MTPQELRTSILFNAMQGRFVGEDWKDDKENLIFKFLWEVTTWDKKFKGIEKKKQPKVISYFYYLAADMKALERADGDVYLLSTGQYEGYTTLDLVKDTVSEGEVVSIPWGGTPNIKYYKGKFVTSDNRIATSNNTDVLDNKFLYYYMLSQYDYLKSIYRGTSLKHPEMAAVLDMRIPVPTLKKQKDTIAKIEELLPLIDRYEKAYTRLEDFNKRFPVDMQKSILQMAIQGKLVEQRAEEGTGEELYQQIQAEKAKLIKAGKIKKEKPLADITDDEIPFEIPENWKWVRLTVAALTIVDCPHSTPAYYDDETGYYAIGTKCLNEKGTINFLFNIDQPTYAKRTERLIPQDGDIVYSREGSIVCRAVILPKGKKIALGQRVMLIRCPYGINNRYLQLFLMAENTVKELTKNYKGVGVKHINVADVCALPIPLPPLAEQKRIVAKLEELLPLCDKLK